MADSDKKDPQPSMFSWLDFPRMADDRQVQMNPISAMQQMQTISTVKRLVGGVAMIALVLAVIGGTFYYLQGGAATNASFNFKQSLSGAVLSVDRVHNSFALAYTSSPDTRVSSLGKSLWIVQLPPGTSFADAETGKTCFTVADLTGDLSAKTPDTCSGVIVRGRKLLIEYLFMVSGRDEVVAKTIIGQK